MTFLLEIGTEELPPHHLTEAIRQLKAGVPKSLTEARLAYRKVLVYGTPRRLAVLVKGLAAQQLDQVVEVLGPAVRIAYDGNGRPTPAAIGFAKGQGVPVSALIRKTTEKGEFVCARRMEKGKPAAFIIKTLAPQWMRGLEFPKSMRWMEGAAAIRFSRPIRWLTAMVDGKSIAFSCGGVTASAMSRGHRFAFPARFRLPSAEGYPTAMKRRKVMVDPAERQATIRRLAARVAKPFGRPLLSDALVEELAGLVEWPEALVGRFDESYLSLPADVLIMVMTKHQRYIPVACDRGLAPAFVVVTNGTGKAEVVRAGHERVLKARFADAQFFYQADVKTPLGQRVDSLRGVTWLEGLGTLYEKTERLIALAGEIASALGLGEGDRAAALRAARLAKADQVTEMVKEMPELEGVMGAHYAKVAGEPEAVCEALKELYWPRGVHASWPLTAAGTVVNLAERLDHVLGCFVGGKIPTGSEDPYGARRQAVAIVQWAMEKSWNFALLALAETHIKRFPGVRHPSQILGQWSNYMQQRVESALAEAGVPADRRRAVLAGGWDPVVDAKRRADALAVIAQRPTFVKEMQTFSRVTNILPKVMRTEPVVQPVDPERFQDEAEKALHHQYHTVGAAVDPFWRQGEYVRGYEELVKMGPAIDRFFDGVLVMADDPIIRQNRLNLLHRIHRLFLRLADFSQIVLA